MTLINSLTTPCSICGQPLGEPGDYVVIGAEPSICLPPGPLPVHRKCVLRSPHVEEARARYRRVRWIDSPKFENAVGIIERGPSGVLSMRDVPDFVEFEICDDDVPRLRAALLGIVKGESDEYYVQSQWRSALQLAFVRDKTLAWT